MNTPLTDVLETMYYEQGEFDDYFEVFRIPPNIMSLGYQSTRRRPVPGYIYGPDWEDMVEKWAALSHLDIPAKILRINTQSVNGTALKAALTIALKKGYQ